MFARYDHLLYPPGSLQITVQEWLEKKVPFPFSPISSEHYTDRSTMCFFVSYLQTGIMGRFPFGAFVYKRMDDRMKDKPEWKEALKKNPGVDPMGQLPGQPHIECKLSLLPSLFVRVLAV